MPGAARTGRIEVHVNFLIANSYHSGDSESKFPAHLLRYECIVEIRIDTSSDGNRTIVRVSGRMAGTAVKQVREVYDRIEGETVLELTYLVAADADGIDLIRELEEASVEVSGATPYIRYLLDEAK